GTSGAPGPSAGGPSVPRGARAPGDGRPQDREGGGARRDQGPGREDREGPDGVRGLAKDGPRAAGRDGEEPRALRRRARGPDQGEPGGAPQAGEGDLLPSEAALRGGQQ